MTDDGSPKDTPVIIKKRAIDAALSQNWELAIELNTRLITSNPSDLDSLNRLGYAYMKNGAVNKAKKYFQQVIKIDAYNQIANRNLQRIENSKDTKNDLQNCSDITSPLLFLEDPGKTKIVHCINVAPIQVLSKIQCGQKVFLVPKLHSVEIRDDHKNYLGALPDDISFQIIRYVKGGNQYSAHVKNTGKNTLTLFLRELKRGRKFMSQPSFLSPILTHTNIKSIYAETKEDQQSPLSDEDPAQD